MRRLGVIAVALSALVFATAAAATAPATPVKVAGLTAFGRALPYGKSRMLILNARGGEGAGGIARLDEDGSLDPSFGDGSIVHVKANDAAVTSDGKILIVATGGGGAKANSEARVTRLLADGQVDRSFGNEGSVGIRFGRNGNGQTIAVAANGDILVGGTRVDDPRNTYFTECDLGVARLEPDGSPDPTFGHRGVEIFKVGDEIGAQQIAPTPSGGILVEEGNDINAYLHKLNRDGSPDRDFGYDGYLPIEGRRGKSGERQLLLPSPGFVEQPDGKILVAAAGLVRTGPEQELVGRIDTKGHMDHSWGHDGWAVLPEGVEAFEKEMTLLPDGAVVIGGTFAADKGKQDDFGAVALDQRGRLDRKFANRGTCRARLPGLQRVSSVVTIGDRAIVIGREGTTASWLLACPAIP